MSKVKTVVTARLIALPALENLFVTFIYFLKKRSFVTFLAYSYIPHPIIGINEDVNFSFGVVGQFMVNAIS